MKIKFKISKESNILIYIVAIISKILVVLLSLFTTAMINRCLGVELKGEYAYINNWITIFITIFSLGIGQTYGAYRRRFGEEPKNTFVALTLIQTAIVFLIFVIAYILKANYYVTTILLVTTFSVLRSNILHIAAVEDVKKRDINTIIYKLIYTFLVFIVFIKNIRSLNVMIALLIIDEIIINIGTFIKYKFKPDFNFLKKNKTNIREIYKLSIIAMLMFLMMTLNYNLDTIMLKQISTNYSVGLYSVGVTLANMLWLIPDAFKDVMFHKTAKEDSIKDIVLSIKFNIYLALFIILGFVILGKWFIKFMYGIEYIEAYNVTVMLFVGSLSMIIYKLIHPLYISKGKQSIVLAILFISVVSNVIINLLLIPKFDIIGAAIASVVSYTICSMIFLYIFCKEYKVSISDFFIIKKSEIESVRKKLEIG